METLIAWVILGIFVGLIFYRLAKFCQHEDGVYLNALKHSNDMVNAVDMRQHQLRKNGCTHYIAQMFMDVEEVANYKCPDCEREKLHVYPPKPHNPKLCNICNTKLKYKSLPSFVDFGENGILSGIIHAELICPKCGT